MRSLFLVLLAAVLLSQALYSQSIDSPVTEYDPRTNLPSRETLSAAAHTEGLTLGQDTAIQLNRLGFTLYEKKQFTESIPFFRAAADRDPSMVVAHFNLACVLSLSGTGLSDPGTEELLYHLHRSVEIDPARLSKIKTDPDLEQARQLPRVRGLVAAYEAQPEWEWREKSLYRVIGQQSFLVADTYEAHSPVAPFEPIALKSRSGKWIVFLSKGNEPRLKIVNSGGLVRTLTEALLLNSMAVYYERINIVFTPDEKKVAIPADDGILLFDTVSLKITRLSTIPEDRGLMDIPLEWRGANLRFKRGSTFEYSFAGEEWEWDARSGISSRLRGGRVWAGESLR